MAKKKAKPRPQRLGAELTGGTRRRLCLLFAPEHRAAAASLLIAHCGNDLPFLEQATPSELDRFRYAALKLSGGDLGLLREAIRLAKDDWRDLLVAAGFGNHTLAHRYWLPKPRRH